MSVTNASDKVANASCCSEAPSVAHAGSASVEASNAQEPSLASDVLLFVRYWLKDRRVLVGIAAAVIVGGTALNWGWLVAVGAAPLVLMLAPCAAMCAIGLCGKGKGEKTSASDQNTVVGDMTGGGAPLASRATKRESDVSPH